MITLPDRLPESGKFAYLNSWLNRLRDAVQSVVPQPAPGQELIHSALGTAQYIPRGAEPEAADLAVDVFYVVAELDNALSCSTAPGGPAEILVAKPFLLARARYDTLTFSLPLRVGFPAAQVIYRHQSTGVRVATLLGLDETQLIIPEYLPGSPLLAARFALSHGAEDFEYLDLNLDSRGWVKVEFAV
jgi:hypothetical protein